MNVGDLIDELARYDRNTPVNISARLGGGFVVCDECGYKNQNGAGLFSMKPTETKRTCVGSGHRLTVVINTEEI